MENKPYSSLIKSVDKITWGGVVNALSAKQSSLHTSRLA